MNESQKNQFNIVEMPVLNIPNIVRKGFVQCMDGFTSWINTESDEMIKVDFNDRENQLKYYCKYVKVTIEVIDEKELDINKNKNDTNNKS